MRSANLLRPPTGESSIGRRMCEEATLLTAGRSSTAPSCLPVLASLYAQSRDLRFSPAIYNFITNGGLPRVREDRKSRSDRTIRATRPSRRGSIMETDWSVKVASQRNRPGGGLRERTVLAVASSDPQRNLTLGIPHRGPRGDE